MASQTTICTQSICANTGRMNNLKLESNKPFTGVLSDPLLILKNTNDDNVGPILALIKDPETATVASDEDIVGAITFSAKNDIGNDIQYITMYTGVAEATNGQEAGVFLIEIATGGDTDIGFSLTGLNGSTEQVVNASIGVGTKSTLTVPGGISVPGTSLTGVSGGSSNWYSYGAGAGTVAPSYSQITMGGVIQSKIRIDLTGFGVKGDAANDVVGIPAGGAAYIAKYNGDEMGRIFKTEVIVMETFGESTGTITNDLDIAFNSSAALVYDGAAGTAEINTGIDGAVLGNSTEVRTPGLSTDDYIYLVEGDTAATTGVYSNGKLVIIFYGYKWN